MKKRLKRCLYVFWRGGVWRNFSRDDGPKIADLLATLVA